MNPFNAIQCPLTGVNLIEASAGTGKTHALTSLYLRFILEAKLTPGRILVITYTKAATAELKRRIRKMLQDAQTAFTTGSAENSFLRDILNQYPSASARNKAAVRLLQALANFDEAAIHTIHGFCQRILIENAFESSTGFDVEPIDNQEGLEQEFIEDFWRRNFYLNNPVVVGYALSAGINKDHFRQLLKMALAKPDLQIIPDRIHFTKNDGEEQLQRVDEKFREFKEVWRNRRGEIIASLQDKALHANTYGRKVDNIVREIDRIVLQDRVPLPLPPAMIKLSRTALCAKTKKGETTPEHPAFLVCEDLCTLAENCVEALDNCVAEIKRQFLEELLAEFPRIKQEKNVLYFDDLLSRARLALRGNGGEQLAEILREKYRAVLIDEFQDTDPVQFAVLQTAFLSAKSENAVFYIGDPKQAIYSFRGADIFAYLRASASINSKYTMQENWRSEASFVNAVNVLFGRPGRAFVYDEIGYNQITAAKGAQIDPLICAGDDNTAALQWWFVPADENSKPVGVTKARRIITRAVVAEISRLLTLGRNKKAFIGDNPLQESDIAVLVRKNSEAATMQKELTEVGIPSVLFSAQSVFVSGEAEELERFLRGVVFCENEGYLLAALATSLFSLRAEDLSACLEDESALMHWRARFQEYRDLWRFSGFLTMFYFFLDREHVRPRIMSSPGGERTLTNYLHLAQELEPAQGQGSFNFHEILRRFTEMRMQADIAGEENQLRLETDKNCVKIVTIHKSKGLEYPVVFCPFAWESGKRKDEKMPLFFHDEKNNWQLTVDLGSGALAANKELYAREILAEDCRLLYVALTRAKNRCYFVSGEIKNIEDSAVAYLFYRPEDNTGDGKKGLNGEEMYQRVVSFSQTAPQDIQITKIDEIRPVQNVPEEEKEESLHFRPFRGVIDQNWKIASFTYLTNSRQPHSEEKEQGDDDYDSGFAAPGAGQGEFREYENMLNFHRGTTSGILLHEILEELDFSRTAGGAADSLILSTLEKYGYDPLWLAPIARMLETLAAVRLAKPDDGEFSLEQIAAGNCVKEMEFYFPLRDITPEEIMRILEQCDIYKKDSDKGEHNWTMLNFPPVRGLLKGFIDIIFEFQGKFYLADWKSNYLGNDYAQYSPANLKRAMSQSSYILQYLIYTVALNKYLQKRVRDYNYEKHFGGVYYIFLRGLNLQADKGNGIYFDLPDYGLIRQLDRLMLPNP